MKKQKDLAVDLNEARIDDDAEISILGDEDDESGEKGYSGHHAKKI